MAGKKRIPSGLYTASEAIKIIGVSPSTFYKLVNTGKINRVIPEGKREGGYRKQEVNLYVRNRKAMNAPYEMVTLDFGLALAEDLPQVFDLVSRVSDGHAVPEVVLKAWIRKNPQSVYVLRHKDEVVGYVSGFVLPMETLMLRMDGTRLNAEIPIDDILPIDTPGPVPFYIAEMAVKFSQESIRRGKPVPSAQLGKILFEHTFNLIAKDLPKQGCMIGELYAVGSSDFGIKMCKRLGMHPIEGLTKGVRADRMPCKISINEAMQSLLFNRMSNRSKAA